MGFPQEAEPFQGLPEKKVDPQTGLSPSLQTSGGAVLGSEESGRRGVGVLDPPVSAPVINTQAVRPCTGHKQSESEMKTPIPCITVAKRVDCLGIKVIPPKVQSFKTSLEETEKIEVNRRASRAHGPEGSVQVRWQWPPQTSQLVFRQKSISFSENPYGNACDPEEPKQS